VLFVLISTLPPKSARIKTHEINRKMPPVTVVAEPMCNEGASTSSAALTIKQDKKKNMPWIEKYRPQVFEEIMGK